MLRTWAFVTDLARAGKDYQETKAAAVEGAYGDQTLQKMVISAILKKVKAGRSTKNHLKPIKTRQNSIPQNLCCCCHHRRLLPILGVSEKTFSISFTRT
jgi:hypothetical protein